MKCPKCKEARGALIDMAPSPSGRHECPRCHATVQLSDLGFTPTMWVPLQGPPVVPLDEKQCKLATCGCWFVPEKKNDQYCSDDCRRAVRRAQYVPKVRAEIARLRLNDLFVGAGVPSESGWHQQDGGA